MTGALIKKESLETDTHTSRTLNEDEGIYQNDVSFYMRWNAKALPASHQKLEKRHRSDSSS